MKTNASFFLSTLLFSGLFTNQSFAADDEQKSSFLRSFVEASGEYVITALFRASEGTLDGIQSGTASLTAGVIATVPTIMIVGGVYAYKELYPSAKTIEDGLMLSQEGMQEIQEIQALQQMQQPFSSPEEDAKFKKSCRAITAMGFKKIEEGQKITAQALLQKGATAEKQLSALPENERDRLFSTSSKIRIVEQKPNISKPHPANPNFDDEFPVNQDTPRESFAGA